MKVMVDIAKMGKGDQSREKTEVKSGRGSGLCTGKHYCIGVKTLDVHC